MFKINRKTKSGLSLLLTMILVLGSLGSFAYADNKPINLELNSAKVDLREEALGKIMPEVMEDLENEDVLEVLVYMKDQVDTEMIAQATRNAVSGAMTPYKTKLAVRRGVVEALRDKAELTQMDLLKYLEQEELKGNVLEYESFFIVNTVYIKATKEVIENIAYRGEVERIYKNKTHYLEKPIVVEGENKASDDGIEWNIERVNAPQVWELGFDGTGAVVGSLDSGVDWTHPALKDKWRGYDPNTGATNPDGNWFDPVYGATLPADSDTHGTHVMGTAVGQEPDGSNKIGVAPGAKWIAARVFNTAGSTTDKILLDAAQWMAAPGGNPDNAPDVVNNSWGGLDGIDDWYRDAVNNWRNAEIVPVFSAGNQRQGEPAPWPGSIANPANYPESFAVAATDKNNLRAYFSKLGPSPYDESLVKPEISAPGVNIRSSVPGGYQGGYSGTSMSAPHITGTVALMVSANSSLSVDEIEQIIEETAIGLTDSTYPESPNFGYGYGLVNAFDAVSSMATGSGEIKGKVLTEGRDLEEPIIVHEQEIFEAYAGSDIDIKANISDDVSILEAELLVKEQDKSYWYSVPMGRISGDHKDGVYEGTISYDMLSEPGIIYKIRARDYGGNEIITDEYNIDIKFGIIPDEYETDFEIQPIGWYLDGDWEWGEPSGPSPEPYIGTKLIGTILDGNYNNRSDSLLITPPIDLRDSTLEEATLRFHQWYAMENNWDFGTIYITNDYAETLTEVKRYTGEPKEWEEIVLNLEEYIGSEDPIFVIFHFTSDGSGQRAGWYVDNVRLIGIDEEAPGKIEGLIAEPTMAGIRLSWNPSPEGDLDEYIVYRSETSGEDYEEIGRTSSVIFLDNELEADTTYYYVVTAVDFSGNESEYSDEVSGTAPNVVTVFNTNFEEDNGGFTTGTTETGRPNDWEWGKPTSRLGPGSALTGENVWATNLDGLYSSYHRGYIESPDITIPEDVIASLFFDYWMDAEQFSTGGTMWDYGNVQVSDDDGATWKDLTGRIGGRVQEWENKEVNLGDYSGKTIRIRFFFYSDSGGNYEGWHIDNVLVAGVEFADADKVVMAEPIAIEEYEDEIKEENIKEEYDYPEVKFNIRNKTREDYRIIEDSELTARRGGLPLDAVVTVLETGRSVRTNPATGEFAMKHAANKEDETWTLRAEAYGHYPKDVVISLSGDEEVYETIVLDKIPQGRIVGQVIDRYYKDPAANAVIRVVEDPNIGTIVADEEGRFTISGVPEGKYTLKVSASGFEPGEVEVEVRGNEDTVETIGLKRFVGYSDEIIYDDGTAENALVVNGANYGLAVRFTPAEYGNVVGVNAYFWDTSWPSPGGNNIGFTIYETDEAGTPKKVGEPIFVDVERGAWNFIDLSSFNFGTDRDFYISTIQPAEGSYCPGLGFDEDSPHTDRSYLNIDGDFRPVSGEDLDGSFMLRAVIDLSVDTPEITNLQEINYTNEDSITVEGKVTADGKVNVYVNDEKIELQTENKAFSIEINLEDEITTIMVSSELDGRETEPSKAITIIKDKIAPELEVMKPIDEERINVELVHVTGNVYDKYLDRVLINDIEAEIDEDGNFHERLLVDDGENIITIKAIDLAGNITEETRKVIVDLDSPVLENIEPSEDLVLKPGDTLTVRFNAETGGEGRFVIASKVETDSIRPGIIIPESEEIPGLYEVDWTIPAGFGIRNGLIEIEFTDLAGNTVIGIAEGRVTIESSDKPVDPEVPEDEEPMENLPSNTVIIGDEAFDIRYLNNNEEAQLKLIEWYSQGKEIFIKLSANLIVNIRGDEVDIDELPEELIYYDVNGDTIKYVRN